MYTLFWFVSEDMERAVVFMSATEAQPKQAHGIVDLVAVENANTGDFM